MKRPIATALCLMLCAGCAPQADPPAAAGAPQAETVNPQAQALAQAEQAGLLHAEKEQMSAEQALEQVAAPFEDGQTARLTDETLSIQGEDGASRTYFVFEVADAAGEPVGKLAIDRESGEKYYYLGDGVLEDYSSFPLYDPAAEAHPGWAGTYSSAVGVTLELEMAGEDGLAFRFSDGTTGMATIDGETAHSADGALHFLLVEPIVTVAGGGLTGNYTAAG